MRMLDRALGKRNAHADRSKSGAAFVATNNGVQHSVSPTALTITQGLTVLCSEPMLEYWSA